MKEYPVYSISKIENELTWEQVYLLLSLIRRRIKREQSGDNKFNNLPISSKATRRKVRNYDIEDIADGKVKHVGFGIERVKKNVDSDR